MACLLSVTFFSQEFSFLNISVLNVQLTSSEASTAKDCAGLNRGRGCVTDCQSPCVPEVSVFTWQLSNRLARKSRAGAVGAGGTRLVQGTGGEQGQE